MRLISQDGTDYPYEQMIISTEHSDYTGSYIIYGRVVTSISASREILAKYSTEKRIQAALKGMYKEYSRYSTNYGTYGFPKYYRFPADEEVEGENDEA